MAATAVAATARAGPVIAPPRRERPRTADVEVLFEAAWSRRRRRRRLVGAVSCVLVAGAVALALTAGWPRPGAVARPRPAAVAAAASRFRLPPATVGWVDYNGQLHVGDVATLAQHAVANVREGSGIGQLVPAGGYLYAGGSAVIWRFDPATGQTRPVARGAAVFASADGQRVYVPQSASSLMVLPASGRGTARRLTLPAGWFIDPPYLPAQTVAGGVVVESQSGGPSRPPGALAVWNPATGTLKVIATTGADVLATFTGPGARSSLLAWQPDACLFRSCPLEITDTASLSTVTVRSPLQHGFTTSGAAFSPDGSRLAVFARITPVSSLNPGRSVLALASTRTGRVRTVPGVRLDTTEDSGWALWLPGGDRLLAGALQGSYAVDTTTYAARPFFFFPAVSDHDIMNTPDVNFSAALLPARG